MEGIEFMTGWQIFIVNIVIFGAPMVAGFYRQNEKIKAMENENQKLRARVASLEQENYNKDRKIEELYERLATGGRKGI